MWGFGVKAFGFRIQFLRYNDTQTMSTALFWQGQLLDAKGAPNLATRRLANVSLASCKQPKTRTPQHTHTHRHKHTETQRQTDTQTDTLVQSSLWTDLAYMIAVFPTQRSRTSCLASRHHHLCGVLGLAPGHAMEKRLEKGRYVYTGLPGGVFVDHRSPGFRWSSAMLKAIQTLANRCSTHTHTPRYAG